MSEEAVEKFGFVGPQEIRATVETLDETPGGDLIIEVYYEGVESPELFPKKVFDSVRTEEPQDYNHIREARKEPLLKELMTVLLEHDLTVADSHHIIESLGNRVTEVFNRCTSYLWTKDDAKYIPGVTPLVNESLLSAHRILSSIKDVKPSETTEASEESAE